MNPITVAACTLGCKVNQYDTEALLKALSAAGYAICDFDDTADIYIINTCTVTGMGEKKSRQMIRKARNKNPNACLVVCGCYAQIDPDGVKNKTGADLVLGTRAQEVIVQALADFGFKTGETTENGMPVSQRTRAYVKVQDGCDRFCSYCIVPYARGSVVSRTPEAVLKEAEMLVRQGFREIVLAGIHVASYGKDLNGETAKAGLAGLLERVHPIEGLERIRLSSIEPYAVDENFCFHLKKLPKLCDHFHLSLQSGCDRTLARMNRRYTASAYAEAAQRLRTLFPDTALTTDVIVGFPGETEADFEESLAFVAQIGFARLHVFEYSPKQGTAAATFPNQVPPSVKSMRSAQMRTLGKAMFSDFIKARIGQDYDVLFEQKEKGCWEGRTTNYMTVRVLTQKNLFNQIVSVRITDVEAEGAAGVLH